MHSSRISKLRLQRYISGVSIKTLRSVSSTNDYFKEIDGVGRPMLVVAETQTSGKGRMGRSFSSQRGGIYFSLMLENTACPLLKITPIAAVCTAKAVEKATGRQAGIKWVNDIYLEGRKAAGILCERKGERTVIGIGINYQNKLPSELALSAVSLAEYGRVKLRREQIIAEVVNALLIGLCEGRFDADYYRERLLYRGEWVCCKKEGAEIMGILVDIDEDGALRLDCAGVQSVICAGEVTLRKL